MNNTYSYRILRGSRILFGSLLLLGICYGQFTFPGKANPHGGDDCSLCHDGGGEPGKANFRSTSCTDCHSRSEVNTKIHQLDDLDLTSANISIPKNFKLESHNEFSCISCHQVACRVDRANQTFLRGGPFKVELDFCYQCHDQNTYKRVNPHIQTLADGSTDKSTCLQCHTKVPSAEDHPTIANEMHLDMSATCNKCHFLHNHEENHQGKNIELSRKATIKRFRETKKRYKIELPLSSDNQIQCNTCHYTHNRGTLADDQVVYVGDGENLRYLRLEKENLCYACHDL